MATDDTYQAMDTDNQAASTDSEDATGFDENGDPKPIKLSKKQLEEDQDIPTEHLYLRNSSLADMYNRCVASSLKRAAYDQNPPKQKLEEAMAKLGQKTEFDDLDETFRGAMTIIDGTPMKLQHLWEQNQEKDSDLADSMETYGAYASYLKELLPAGSKVFPDIPLSEKDFRMYALVSGIAQCPKQGGGQRGFKWDVKRGELRAPALGDLTRGTRGKRTFKPVAIQVAKIHAMYGGNRNIKDINIVDMTMKGDWMPTVTAFLDPKNGWVKVSEGNKNHLDFTKKFIDAHYQVSNHQDMIFAPPKKTKILEKDQKQ